jgi:hypothetical protein
MKISFGATRPPLGVNPDGTETVATRGTNSRNSSSRFAASAVVKMLTPVE